MALLIPPWRRHSSEPRPGSAIPRVVPALFILLAGARVELVDEVYTIPPSEWRYVQVDLKQTPVSVHCNFQVVSRVAQGRVALLSRADPERLRADEPHVSWSHRSPRPPDRWPTAYIRPGSTRW